VFDSQGGDHTVRMTERTIMKIFDIYKKNNIIYIESESDGQGYGG